MTMNFGEAVQLASRMKGRFKAFEKLEQVIEAARIADGEIQEKTKQVAELRSEVEKLKERYANVKAQLKGSKTLLKERLDDANAKAQELIRKGEQQLQERLKFLQQQVKNADEERNRIYAVVELAREEAAQEKERLTSEVAELQATVESLKDTARKVVGL